jgi:hypothetical protein
MSLAQRTEPPRFPLLAVVAEAGAEYKTSEVTVVRLLDEPPRKTK